MCLNLSLPLIELNRFILFNLEILRRVFGLENDNDKGGLEEER